MSRNVIFRDTALPCFSLLSSEKKKRNCSSQHKTSIVTIAIIMTEIELIRVQHSLV